VGTLPGPRGRRRIAQIRPWRARPLTGRHGPHRSSSRPTGRYNRKQPRSFGRADLPRRACLP